MPTMNEPIPALSLSEVSLSEHQPISSHTNQPDPSLSSIHGENGRREKNESNEGCQDFIFFPKLPIELRLKIWGFAALHFGRIVVVKPFIPPGLVITDLELAIGEIIISIKWNFQSSQPVSPLLAVNQESRNETLPKYRLFTSHDSSLSGTTAVTPRYCNMAPYNFLFCYHLDTLFIFNEVMGVHKDAMFIQPYNFKAWFGGKDIALEACNELRSLAVTRLWDEGFEVDNFKK